MAVRKGRGRKGIGREMVWRECENSSGRRENKQTGRSIDGERGDKIKRRNIIERLYHQYQ